MSKKNKKKKLVIVFVGVLIISCGISIVFNRLNKVVRLQYNFAEVEFVKEENRITCIDIEGRFPYNNISCLSEEQVIDVDGNVTDVYKVGAEFSLRLGTSMRLNIQSSDDVTYKYILEFADRNITIINGIEEK